MQNAESNEIDGAIVFVDFIKAFDSSELEFMLSVLKHFVLINHTKSYRRWKH